MACQETLGAGMQVRSLGGQRLAFCRPWTPVPGQAACNQTPQGVPQAQLCQALFPQEHERLAP